MSQLATGPQLPPVQKRKARADIVFCIDCTGSMEPCIEGVVEGVNTFVTGLHSAGRVDYRLRLIAYRDLPYGDETHSTDFTSDADQFRNWVRALSPRANDTIPESTLDAVCMALQSPWRERCHRSVVVFTDAGTHTQLHGSTAAPTRDGVQAVIDLQTKAHALIFILAPQDGAYETIAKQQQVIYQALPVDDRRYEGLRAVDFNEVLDFVGRSISSVSQLQ
jgi:von Willebrand factor type A domain